MTVASHIAAQHPSFARELSVAAKLVREAGKIALHYHGTDLKVDRKPGNEPVTIADRECSALIVRGLQEAFPDDVVISEEQADDRRRLAAQRVWYVDPIDGTKNFVLGKKGYSVMIGLAVAHQPVLGLVYQPNHDTLVLASKGHGSWSLYGDQEERMQCSTINDPKRARVLGASLSTDSESDQIARCLGVPNIQSIGSVGIKLSAVALGVSDMYVNPATHCRSWDTCGPQVIVEEAGGSITDLYGDPLRYDDPTSLKHNRGIIASNSVLHGQVVAKFSILFPLSTTL